MAPPMDFGPDGIAPVRRDLSALTTRAESKGSGLIFTQAGRSRLRESSLRVSGWAPGLGGTPMVQSDNPGNMKRASRVEIGNDFTTAEQCTRPVSSPTVSGLEHGDGGERMGLSGEPLTISMGERRSSRSSVDHHCSEYARRSKIPYANTPNPTSCSREIDC